MQSQKSSRHKKEGEEQTCNYSTHIAFSNFSRLKMLMSINLYLLKQHLKILVQTTQHPVQDTKRQTTTTNNLYPLYTRQNFRSLVF